MKGKSSSITHKGQFTISASCCSTCESRFIKSCVVFLKYDKITTMISSGVIFSVWSWRQKNYYRKLNGVWKTPSFIRHGGFSDKMLLVVFSQCPEDIKNSTLDTKIKCVGHFWDSREMLNHYLKQLFSTCVANLATYSDRPGKGEKNIHMYYIAVNSHACCSKQSTSLLQLQQHWVFSSVSLPCRLLLHAGSL